MVVSENMPKKRTTVDFIHQNGYDAEVHYALTEDGYILTLQRIVKNDPKLPKERPPLLMVHGLQSCAINYVAYLGKDSLAFMMADRGYDVWLGNVRGTPDSMNHTSIDVQKNPKEYWDFSIHKIGYYDTPAMIDYILKKTGFSKLFYQGHSQGGTILFIMGSTRPEYNKKIALASLFAAVATLKYADNQFFIGASKNWRSLRAITSTLGIYQVPGNGAIKAFCQFTGRISGLRLLCRSYLFLTAGYEDNDQLDLKLLPDIFVNFPASASMQQIFHFLQIFDTGKFRQYDYGEEKNIELYGSPEPPAYDPKLITAPIAYYYGENDCFTTPEDVKYWTDQLPNVVLLHKVPYKKFNHIDFLIAKDIVPLLHNTVADTIEKYTER